MCISNRGIYCICNRNKQIYRCHHHFCPARPNLRQRRLYLSDSNRPRHGDEGDDIDLGRVDLTARSSRRVCAAVDELGQVDGPLDRASEVCRLVAGYAGGLGGIAHLGGPGVDIKGQVRAGNAVDDHVGVAGGVVPGGGALGAEIDGELQLGLGDVASDPSADSGQGGGVGALVEADRPRAAALSESIFCCRGSLG